MRGHLSDAPSLYAALGGLLTHRRVRVGSENLPTDLEVHGSLLRSQLCTMRG